MGGSKGGGEGVAGAVGGGIGEDRGREGGVGGEQGEEEKGDDGDAAAPDVVLTANHVGKLRKIQKTKKWRLDLEGGAIEGHGQVFVFDRCVAQLQEPR